MNSLHSTKHHFLHRYTLPWVAAAIVLLACGGGTSVEGGGGMSSMHDSMSDGGGPSTSAGGGVQWTDAGPSAEIQCTMQGEHRPATPSENAQYCVCAPVSRTEGTQTTTWLLWSCYGPASSAPTPSPTTCTFTDVNPGSNDGSCWVDWSSCSNGKDYSFSCVDHNCSCLVGGQRSSVLLEPRDSCPEDKVTLDSLCGWNLH